jgi:hypothetical protein
MFDPFRITDFYHALASFGHVPIISLVSLFVRYNAATPRPIYAS